MISLPVSAHVAHRGVFFFVLFWCFLFSLLVLKVYVQLLRCIQPEVKELVHAALDILVPALPFRLTTTVSIERKQKIPGGVLAGWRVYTCLVDGTTGSVSTCT